MPIKQVTSVLDDYDGQELPEDTNPTELVLNGLRYNLYLSDENKATLADVLNDWTKDATPQVVPTYRPINGAVSPGVGPDERKALMAWSREQEGMKAVAERGRVADSVLKAWQDAGKPGFNE